MPILPSDVDGSNGPAKLVLSREPKRASPDSPGKTATRDAMIIVAVAAGLLFLLLFPVRRFIV